MTTMQELELEYYIDPADIFEESPGEGVKTIIDLVILPKLSPFEDRLRIILTEVTKHPEFLLALEERCKADAMRNQALWAFTNDYRIYDLRDNRKFWITLIKVVEKSIRDFFK